MKKALIFLLLILNLSCLLGQGGVGIGTSNPHNSAALDVASNNKGLLVPRMTNTARLAIASPANGLLVYDSTLHRLYQFQEGVWRYMLTNESWLQSSTRNWTYNSSDSIGLGTTIPTEKLDVNGNIRSREDIFANNNIIASGDITAAAVVSTGNIGVTGSASLNSTLTTYGDIKLDNTGTTLQLQNNGVKKAYFQLAGNNLRLGTNSGNTTGKMLFRMNGTDAITIDRFANIEMLQNNTNEGNIQIGWKLCRFDAPETNMLPVMSGRVAADASNTDTWVSPLVLATWDRVSLGRYEISTLFPIVTPYSSIIATPLEPQRFCVTTYLSPGKFRVDTYTRSGAKADCGFSFLVFDPLN